MKSENMAQVESKTGNRALDLAHAGFSPDAKRYDRVRPSYPHEAVAVLVKQMCHAQASADEGIVVVEVGAGTGKFTQLLLKQLNEKSRVICVEPVEAMRNTLSGQPWAVEAKAKGRLEILDGQAGALPLQAASADAVVAAQAFHWFATKDVVQEFARVLKPHGVVAVIWNTRNTDGKYGPWMLEMEAYLDSLYDDELRQSSKKWKLAFEGDSPFNDLQSQMFEYEQPATLEMLVERVLSVSAVARRSPQEQQVIAQRIRDMISPHFPPSVEFNAIPYITEAYWAVKKA